MFNDKCVLKLLSIILIFCISISSLSCYSTTTRYRSVPYTDYDTIEKKVYEPQVITKLEDPFMVKTNIDRKICLDIIDKEKSLKDMKIVSRITSIIREVLSNNRYWFLVDKKDANYILSGYISDYSEDQFTLSLRIKYPRSYYEPWATTVTGNIFSIEDKLQSLFLPKEKQVTIQVEKTVTERIPVTRQKTEEYYDREFDFLATILLLGLIGALAGLGGTSTN